MVLNKCLQEQFKLSIIVPVYNVEKYLRRCLDSIINQTYENIEIILVNDGSTDTSLFICEEYAKKFSKIKLVTTTNGGAAHARNIGLDLAQGDYIGFVDADDYIDCDYFEKMIHIATLNKSDVVVGSYYLFFTEFNKTINPIDRPKNDISLSSYESLLELFDGKNITSMLATKLFRASLFQGYRFSEIYCFLEDVSATYKLLYKSNVITITPYCGYYYVQNNCNALTKRPLTNAKIKSCWDVYLEIIDYNFGCFSNEEQFLLRERVVRLFLRFFFDFLPHFDVKNDNDYLKKIIKTIRNRSFLKEYRPNSKKEHFILVSFKISPFIHYYLRRHALKRKRLIK